METKEKARQIVAKSIGQQNSPKTTETLIHTITALLTIQKQKRPTLQEIIQVQKSLISNSASTFFTIYAPALKDKRLALDVMKAAAEVGLLEINLLYDQTKEEIEKNPLLGADKLVQQAGEKMFRSSTVVDLDI